jgi:hypothetical protein
MGGYNHQRTAFSVRRSGNAIRCSLNAEDYEGKDGKIYFDFSDKSGLPQGMLRIGDGFGNRDVWAD